MKEKGTLPEMVSVRTKCQCEEERSRISSGSKVCTVPQFLYSFRGSPLKCQGEDYSEPKEPDIKDYDLVNDPYGLNKSKYIEVLKEY